MGEVDCGVYAALLSDLVVRGVVGRHDSVLVPFAGAFERSIARALGLTNCVFTAGPPSPAGVVTGDPYRTGFADASFDHVVGGAGPHHGRRPHQVLHEMYRVARATVIAVERQDPPLRRRTPGPGDLARWTRREVRRTVASLAPDHDVPVEFHGERLIGRRTALGVTVRKDLARVRPKAMAT